jgi:hypothetical protein
MKLLPSSGIQAPPFEKGFFGAFNAGAGHRQRQNETADKAGLFAWATKYYCISVTEFQPSFGACLKFVPKRGFTRYP